MYCDYPQKFIDIISNQFGKTNDEDDYIIPPDLFDIPKPLI